MARTPTTQRPEISRWLIATREAHGLTATAFLSALGEGAPNYSTYAQWESGRTTPKASSLEPVFRYWEERGVPRFTAQPARPILSVEERQLALLERQVEAQERQAAAMELHVRLLARQTIATEAIAAAQGATLPGSGAEWVALEDELLALGQSVLADRLSQAQPSAQLP